MANGQEIPNYGEADLKGRTVAGTKVNIRSQVADVTKPLAATNEMVDGGNMVIMHRRGGVVKSVKRLRIRS